MSARAYLQRQWQEDGWLAHLLAPLSRMTARIVQRKREKYRHGGKTIWRAPVPVVVVGNIYVGGTGKTPVVIAAVEGLRALGWTPGVISRGYGANVGDTPRVGLGDNLDPARYGDEPALIARAARAPIAVHPQRALAAQALLREHPSIDVIISDDGLQHPRLARDVEIVVQDERGLGNGRLLPAGPLREPASRLDEVDAVITNHGALPPENAEAPPPRRQNGGPPRLSMWLVPGLARHLLSGQTRPLADFASGGPVAAAAGIGNPRRFFDTLRAAGVKLAQTLPLPDHYAFAKSPFGGIQSDRILITAKDAVKCQRLNDARLWEVGVTARFAPEDFASWLDRAIRDKTGRAPGQSQDQALASLAAR